MFYANTAAGTRALATPHTTATCPVCGDALRAKCGKVVTWHWAHVGQECDPFSEPMTEWHWSWQAAFPLRSREFVITVNGETHRSDVFAPAAMFLEFQHSSISSDEIRTREAFYQRMTWVFDARDAYTQRLSVYRKNITGARFRWRHPRKSLAACSAPVFLDLDGEWLLRIGEIDISPPCTGWGTLIPKVEFVSTMNGEVRPPWLQWS